MAAIDEGVPAPVLASVLFSCFASQGNADVRQARSCPPCAREFGGHEERSHP